MITIENLKRGKEFSTKDINAKLQSIVSQVNVALENPVGVAEDEIFEFNSFLEDADGNAGIFVPMSIALALNVDPNDVTYAKYKNKYLFYKNSAYTYLITFKDGAWRDLQVTTVMPEQYVYSRRIHTNLVSGVSLIGLQPSIQGNVVSVVNIASGYLRLTNFSNVGIRSSKDIKLVLQRTLNGTDWEDVKTIGTLVATTTSAKISADAVDLVSDLSNPQTMVNYRYGVKAADDSDFSTVVFTDKDANVIPNSYTHLVAVFGDRGY